MEQIEVFRKLFTREELEEILQKEFTCLEEYLGLIQHPEQDNFNQGYRMAAFHTLSIGHTYDLLGDREKAEHYYRTTLDYLDHANFQPLWVRVGSLRALGRHKEALEATLNNPHHSEEGLAEAYDRAGDHETAQEMYTKLAAKQHCDPERMENFIYPQCLQFMSDLWERAHNTEKARKYNQLALKAWEKTKNNIEKRLYPIEEAWLYEGVGHIHEKAGDLAGAMEYYQKALGKYELGNKEEYRPSSETHYVDGDWDSHYAGYFSTQLPEVNFVDFMAEYFMNFQLRRIRYRILRLEEKMKREIGLL